MLLLRDLAKLPPHEKRARLSSLVDASLRGEGLANIRLEIRQLEAKYGMTTAEMLAAFKAGELEETYEIVRWSILARGDRA